MKVLFACGGTGGHINPAIAVAKVLRERRPDAEICFAGAKSGMETRLVPAEGFRLECVDIEGFDRKVSVNSLVHNVKNVGKIAASLKWAKKLIDEYKPDVVLGTGGYASFPVLYTAAKRKIPTLIHESNAYPGLTTRLLSKYVSKVLVNFKASAEFFSCKEKVSVVGTPIREDMIYKDKNEARAELNLDARPLIVSFWGSLGAREMNKHIAEFFKLECKNDAWQHIHATGQFGYKWMPDYVREQGVDLKEHKNIDMRDYITDMPRVMAAADLIMCRGGASTLSEITALGKPAIIVPSPNVSANHQEKNARELEKVGGAVVVLEKDCSGELLYKTAEDILKDGESLKKMSASLNSIAILDATQRIYSELCKLCKG